MSVKDVAAYLQINTKKVYALVNEGLIPATKVTGKWLFPRRLVDQWLLENSHGGLLSDRLLLAMGDDPFLQRALARLAAKLGTHALVAQVPAQTEQGLALLARGRADVCSVRWGPVAESGHRHVALLKKHPQHRNWILLRLFEREQGVMVAPAAGAASDVDALLHGDSRWVARNRRHDRNADQLNVVQTAFSEREAASLLARDAADAAPGTRAAATEFGLDFVTAGWEAHDLALPKKVYFRSLFRRLLDEIQDQECRRIAARLSGYDFRRSGEIIWSE